MIQLLLGTLFVACVGGAIAKCEWESLFDSATFARRRLAVTARFLFVGFSCCEL